MFMNSHFFYIKFWDTELSKRITNACISAAMHKYERKW